LYSYSETLKVTISKIVLTGLATVLIIVLMLFPACPNTQAQTGATFTPQDRFSIPELNGSIRFSVNGSCSAATLENGAWSFRDLKLDSAQPLGNLKISAQNSNVTVYAFRAQNLSGQSAIVRFIVEGEGKQTVNLGLNVSQPTSAYEWSVTRPGNVFLAEGEGWNLLPDNTVVVTGLTGNVSVVHYNFSFPNDSNLPFYEKHSVVIITAAVLAVTISVALVIRVKWRK
jgi:hypothetical protein